MTSAPRSPSSWPQNGPARTQQRHREHAVWRGVTWSSAYCSGDDDEDDGGDFAACTRTWRTTSPARPTRQRDECLVLAADAALGNWQPEEAERLRKRLLLTNPNHLLRAYRTMADAMHSSDVVDYVADLRKQWPPETVAKLLNRPPVETVPIAGPPEPASGRGQRPLPPSARRAILGGIQSHDLDADARPARGGRTCSSRHSADRGSSDPSLLDQLRFLRSPRIQRRPLVNAEVFERRRFAGDGQAHVPFDDRDVLVPAIGDIFVVQASD